MKKKPTEMVYPEYPQKNEPSITADTIGKILFTGVISFLVILMSIGVVFADVFLKDYQPQYIHKPVYETRKVCITDRSTTEDILAGAIIGGIIGNNTGNNGDNTAVGAVIGGLAASGDETHCDNIIDQVRTDIIPNGYKVTLEVDGKIRIIHVK